MMFVLGVCCGAAQDGGAPSQLRASGPPSTPLEDEKDQTLYQGPHASPLELGQETPDSGWGKRLRCEVP